MKNKLAIIDYGTGNLFSVQRAVEFCGEEAILTNDPTVIDSSEKIILPGVGAFENGMKGLQKYNLIDTLKEFAESKKPILGICLGMQMLMDKSEEFGNHRGLGLIGGTVKQIPNTSKNGQNHKIPFIGWGELHTNDMKDSWNGSILENIEETSQVYFVHSYTAVPSNLKHRLADSFYNGRQIAAAIRRDNVYGCQFHPERSGEIGLKIINNFLKL